MVDFWIGSSVLLCIAAVVVLWPLMSRKLRDKTANTVTQQALNVAVYKDRLNELEQDKINGVITNEQFDTLKAELESSLLNDVSDDEVQKQPGSKSSAFFPLPVLLMILVALPIVSWGLYAKWGSYNALSDSRINQASGLPSEGAMPNVDVEELLATLQQKLTENPDNLEGWILLGRSLMNMGRYREAVPAFRQRGPGQSKGT